jgi:hypothetical protein
MWLSEAPYCLLKSHIALLVKGTRAEWLPSKDCSMLPLTLSCAVLVVHAEQPQAAAYDAAGAWRGRHAHGVDLVRVCSLLGVHGAFLGQYVVCWAL